MADQVRLAQAIAMLREELSEAMAEGAGKSVRFNVGPVDLEFQVEVGREGGVGGKVRFWVVEAGAEGKLSSTSTQTVKIHLEPLDAVTKAQLLTADVGPESVSVDRGSAPSRPLGPSTAAE